MAHPLPPPGPDHYAARRARWVSPPDHTATAPRQIPHSVARLHRLLENSDIHSDPIWNHGVDQVWNGLVRGNRLKHRLPMSLVIKVIHAAWRRDLDTWPDGAVVPDSDDSRTVPTSSLLGPAPGDLSTKPP